MGQQATAQIGVTGLAVMGRNLARNLARHGHVVALHNRSVERTRSLVEQHGEEGRFVASESMADFVASLERPRAVIVMVKAGDPTDAVIDELLPLLDAGDIVIARQPSFVGYAHDIASNAVSLADGLMKRGARLVTGGTENHLVLIDVSAFGLSGRQAESALLDSGIATNRNSIPRDPNGAWYTSGVRIGTPALTSRGFGAAEFDRVAELIVDVLTATSPAAAASGGSSKAKYRIADGVADKTQSAAAELLAANPLYPGLDVS